MFQKFADINVLINLDEQNYNLINFWKKIEKSSL